MFLTKLSSLRFRIALTVFALEAVMIVFILWQTSSFFEEQTRTRLQNQDNVTLDLITNLSRVALFGVEFDTLQTQINLMKRDPRISQILVTNNEGLVIASSDFDDVGTSFAPVIKDSETMHWLNTEIGRLGQVYIQLSNLELLQSINEARALGLKIAFIGMTIIALVGLLIGYLLTRKLTILNRAIHEFENGDHSISTAFHGHDEVAQLGNGFDRMRSKIDDYIHSLELEKQQVLNMKTSLEEKVASRTQELSNLNEKLERLSIVDELTGLFNRRKLNETLELECRIAKRNDSTLGFLMIDVDSFKKYNDNYGHFMGDETLRKVATALKDSFRRPRDFVARFGGEEMVVVLPKIDKQGLLTIAENLCQNIEALQISHEHSEVSKYVTVSIGAALVTHKEELDPEMIMIKADIALYAAKEGGRNNIVMYSDKTMQKHSNFTGKAKISKI